MQILVTRPLPEAWALQVEIERLGLKALLAPLIDIVPLEISPDIFEGASAVVATSGNGLRALSLSGLLDRVKRLQVYAVGEATGKLASDLKLPNVTAGRGTAAELVPVIAERQAGRPGPVVHLAGDHLAYDLKGALAEKGIEVREVTVYKSVPASALPAETLAAIKSGKIGAVTLMSPRTAGVWTQLAAKHAIEDRLKQIVHVCLSPAVAAKLQVGPDVRIETASAPTSDEIVALIKGLAAQTARE